MNINPNNSHGKNLSCSNPLASAQFAETLAEYHDLALGVDRPFLDYVKDNQINTRAIGGFAGGYSVLPITDCGNGRFDWTGRGETFPAFIIEAYGQDGETTIDLVAWPLDKPQHILTVLGRCGLLGLWQAMGAATYYMGYPLAMHRTPLEWLQADCQGAAVVTPHIAARLFLDLPGKIAGRDQKHSRELAKLAGSIIDPSRFVAPTGDRKVAA